MTRITLQYSKVILLGMLLMLQGCSAFKASHFVPESAENMRECFMGMGKNIASLSRRVH